MADKLCIILSSGDRRVVKTALQYARRTVTEKFMDDTKLFLFGPSEEVIASDAELQEFIKMYRDTGKEVMACKWCSDDYGVTGELEALKIRVEYVGRLVSDAIKDGYIPMVW
jgi:hypothetical protein